VSVIGLRNATHSDKKFVYDVIRSASEEYVIETWGEWDETWQRRNFEEKYDPSKVKVIQLDLKDVGFIEVIYSRDEIFISELNILPEFQNRGIGSSLIKNLTNMADEDKLNVRMQVLKVNPARRLYERLGFIMYGETNTHYLMEKLAPASE